MRHFIVVEGGVVTHVRSVSDNDAGLLQYLENNAKEVTEATHEVLARQMHEGGRGFWRATSGGYEWVPDSSDPEIGWANVREQRDRLLASSDWTQLPDVPLATKEAWATYRQALRDVTLQPDPFNIVWPTAPGA